MRISPAAQRAADRVAVAVAAYQDALAPLDRVCTNMVSIFMALKDGCFDEKTIVGFLSEFETALTRLSIAGTGLDVVGPACDTIIKEIL